MDKHSNLFQTFVNYGRKKFHNIGHRIELLQLPESGAYPIVEHRKSTHKHQTRLSLERPAVDKHNNLFRTFLNYDCKKFYNIGHIIGLLKFPTSGAYPIVEHPKSVSLVRLQPYSQTLDQAKKACQGTALKLIIKISKLRV